MFKKIVVFVILNILNILICYSQIYEYRVITELDEQVQEISGMIIHNEKLWVHNDSGDSAKLYQIDTTNGAVIRTKIIKNAVNYDWEDITKDENYLYIADVGNNSGTRDSLKIYKVLLEDLDNEDIDSINATIISFTYDLDIYSKKKKKRNNTNFDCEAIISKGDSLFIFSKNWIDKKCYFYSIPKNEGHHIATLHDTLNTEGLVCGADYELNSNAIALIGYVYNASAPSFIVILSDFLDNNFFSANVTKYMLNLSFHQTEAIVFRDRYRLWFANENFMNNKQALHEIRLINSNKEENDIYNFNIYPNPVVDNLYITFSDFKKMSCKITDSAGTVVLKKQLDNKTNPIVVDLTSLKSGVYSVEFYNNRYRQIKKIIKISK